MRWDVVKRGRRRNHGANVAEAPCTVNCIERSLSCDQRMNFGIKIIVRTPHVCLPIISRQPAASLCVGIVSLALAGCGLFSSRDGVGIGYYLPLTVQLRPASSIAAAQVQYQDACGYPKTIPIGAMLEEAVKRKTGRVFEKVVTDASGAIAVDGYEDVSLGMTRLDLVISQKANRSYPATLAIGLDFAYTAADGTVLFTKKLQSVGRGEVDVTESSCEVKGLDKLAQEAISNVTDGMAKQLGTSSKILTAAEAPKTGAPRTGGPVPPSPIAAGGAYEAVKAQPKLTAPVPPPAAEEASTLVFRAIIRDENRNQLLHSGEALGVEIEVKNEGPGSASGVEVLVGGTPALVEHIPSVLPVGDLPAGDVKRVSLDGKVGTVTEAGQAELVLALRSQSGSAHIPAAKKFLVAIKPADAPEAAMVPIDVDEVPKNSGKFKQPKAVGIAIGIGQYRETGLPRVKFAAQDAEVMAKYWSAIGGIPPDRIRRLIDSHALKTDVAEAFEEWLPKHVDPTTVVYVYVSGRGIVEPTTGAVSVIPFDGMASSGARVYSLRRLQESLVKLSIYRAIIMLDLSLEYGQLPEGATHAAPLWELEGQDKDKIMWMVGNRAVQEAHAYDLGQHSLYTYHLLRGLGGEADIDKDGTIFAGELCAYSRGRAAKMAREQFGDDQEPLCVPGPGQGAMVRLQPLAKLK